MAVIRGQIFLSGEDVPSAAANLYTVGTGVVRVNITDAKITNYAAAGSDLTIWILQNGESEADVRLAIDAQTIAPDDTVTLSEIIGRSIEQGGAIRALSSNASSLALSVTGTEFTT